MHSLWSWWYLCIQVVNDDEEQFEECSIWCRPKEKTVRRSSASLPERRTKNEKLSRTRNYSYASSNVLLNWEWQTETAWLQSNATIYVISNYWLRTLLHLSLMKTCEKSMAPFPGEMHEALKETYRDLWLRFRRWTWIGKKTPLVIPSQWSYSSSVSIVSFLFLDSCRNCCSPTLHMVFFFSLLCLPLLPMMMIALLLLPLIECCFSSLCLIFHF